VNVTLRLLQFATATALVVGIYVLFGIAWVVAALVVVVPVVVMRRFFRLSWWMMAAMALGSLALQHPPAH
jgi:hypothetical protein